MPGSPESQTGLNISRAENEASVLREKVESGKASNYTEAEKQMLHEKVGNLLNAKAKIEEEISNLTKNHIYMVGVAHLSRFLREASLFDCEDRVYSQVVPKVGIRSVEMALNMMGQEPSKEGYENAMNMIGHQTRKAFPRTEKTRLGYGTKESVQDSQYNKTLARFIAETAIASGELMLAKSWYESLDDTEGMARVQKMIDSYGSEYPEDDPKYKTIEERYDMIQKSGQKFLDTMKYVEDSDIDCVEVLRQILAKVESELEKARQ